MKEMKTFTFPSGDTYEIVDGKARESIANLIDIDEQPDIQIPTMDDLNQKAGKVRIDYAGGNVFKVGDRVLNFAEIYDYHLVSPDFTFIVYNSRAYLCSFVNMPSTGMKEMRFESVINSDLRTKVSSIYIVSNDGVSIANTTVSDINSENSSNKVNAITDALKTSTNHYASVKAVVDYVDEHYQQGGSGGSGGDVPIASTDTAGIVMVDPNLGITMSGNVIRTVPANQQLIDSGRSATSGAGYYRPITPATLDYALLKGFCDGKGPAWSEENQLAAQRRLGADARFEALENELLGVSSIADEISEVIG